VSEDADAKQSEHGLAVLTSVEPEAPTDDLDVFGRWFGDATVVGRGVWDEACGKRRVGRGVWDEACGMRRVG
jgi:hypothetical protein